MTSATATAIPTTARYSPNPGPINQTWRDSLRDYGTGVKNRLFRAKHAIGSSYWWKQFAEMFMWISAFFAAYMCALLIIVLVFAALGI